MSSEEKAKPRRALGRGLDALLPAAPARDAAPPSAPRAQNVFNCAIERIVPRRDQPRQRFDADELDELAATIREHGVIQPIAVRRIGSEDRFEIIAGERRWRAVQKAGLKEIPVVVKDIAPSQAFELALVENLQRADLNAMEVAEAYRRLLEDHGYTHEALAERVGKSRAAVSNVLRLLKLPERVRELVVGGQLDEGHARALLGAADEVAMSALADKAVRGRMSVRQVEALVKGRKPPPARPPKSPNVRDLEERLARRLGVRVSLDHHGPGGTVTVRYDSLDELDRLLALVERG